MGVSGEYLMLQSNRLEAGLQMGNGTPGHSPFYKQLLRFLVRLVEQGNQGQQFAIRHRGMATDPCRQSAIGDFQALSERHDTKASRGFGKQCSLCFLGLGHAICQTTHCFFLHVGAVPNASEDVTSGHSHDRGIGTSLQSAKTCTDKGEP